jgi:hypothetical protein
MNCLVAAVLRYTPRRPILFVVLTGGAMTASPLALALPLAAICVTTFCLGALIAGPIAAAIGVSATQFAAAALIVVVSALCLIPRDIRTIRSDDAVLTDPGDAGLPEPLPAAPR